MMANGLFWSTFTAMFLSAYSLTASAQNYRMCDGNRTGTFADPSDCRFFIFCLNGQPKRYQCHNQKIYSTKTKTCVSASEAIGECTSVFKRTTEVSNPEEYCRNNPNAFLPHPDSCALFYNCSQTRRVQLFLDNYVNECPYMQLFSEKTLSCQHYSRVRCDQRKEPKDVCDYRRFWCGSAHCVPCFIRYPSCNGKPNGRNAIPHLRWASSFIVCQDDRLLTSAECPSRNGRPTVFSPNQRNCVSVYSMPSLFGRKPISCSNKQNGFYADVSSCNRFYECSNQKIINKFTCQSNMIFDAQISTCIHPEQSCSKCGTKANC
ncbi:uncharacterized protein LOC115217201 [Octopus sinensis]|uniref:Uncharacterized protein LOC115217201 n=1 Tax=Octopus sinensis TaxID=2607531 RepID=A0A6P7SY08_9MOLL|nr:uncharacterized protein LOC115217201 [Octopus sinensis]